MGSANFASRALLHNLATARDEAELRSRFMDGATFPFAAHAWGIYLLDAQLAPVEIEVRGAPSSFVLRYEELGRSIDPVMRYVVDRHAPAHEQSVLSPQEWKRAPLYEHVSSRYGLEHIMTGPLVGDGRLIGTVNFGRRVGVPAFDNDDLASLGALCGHLSACLAALRARPAPGLVLPADLLTRRERQIADLVARGLSNGEIGEVLCVTRNTVKQALKRMFRKLEVSARAELVARLRG